MPEPQRENVVFFLGSGASHALNSFAPLDKDLLDRIIRRLSQNWPLSEREKWAAAAEKVEKFLGSHYRGRRAQLWDALMLLDARGSEDREYREIRDIFESQIYGVTAEIMLMGRSSMYHRQAVDFMKQVGKSERNWQVDFVTTNYDLVIDGYIPRWLLDWIPETNTDNTPYGYNLMYGLQQDMTEVQWWSTSQPSLHPPNVDRIASPLLNQERKSKLIKIHGSVNWAFCSEGCKRPFLIHGSGATWALAYLKAEAAAGPEELPQCRQCKKALRRVLATPTEILRRNGPLYKPDPDPMTKVFDFLWKAAEDLLLKADRLVFVGYSLPAEDRHVREWLALANARGSRKTTPVTVVTFGSDSHLRESYTSLFGDEVEFYTEGFVRFIEQGFLSRSVRSGQGILSSKN